MKMRLGLLLAICSALYVTAFVVVHRSSSLRRPAYNLAYWYYSDCDAVEAVEFYGFWPLRQLSYKLFPNFMSEHITERRWAQPVYPPGFEG